MAIGAAKSVSFEKKLNSVRFKISLKNVKNKKILLSGEDQTASDVSCEKNKKSEPDWTGVWAVRERFLIDVQD